MATQHWSDEEPGGPGLDHALSVVRRRKWAALAAFALVCSAGIPIALNLPNIYRATATVLLERHDSANAIVKPTSQELDTRLVTIRQELLSRGTLDAIAEQYQLYPHLRENGTPDDVANQMRRDVDMELTSVNQGNGAPVTIGMRVGYTSRDAELASRVANELAQRYVSESANLGERQSGQTAAFLRAELDQAEKTLARHEARLREYRTRHSDELPQQSAANLAALDRMNEQLRANTDQQLRLIERRDKLADDLSIAESQASAPPDELAQLNARLRELRARYTEKHPEIQQLQAQIAALESRRASTGGAPPAVSADDVARLKNSLTEVENQLATLRRQQGTLRTAIVGYDRRLQVMPQRESELEAIMADYVTAREQRSSLLQRYEEAQLASSLESTRKGETVRILDAAVPPSQPSAPNRVRLLVLVMMLALAAAVGTVLLAEKRDSSFHDVSELREFTRLRVLATIPQLDAPGGALGGGMKMALGTAAVLACCAALAAVSMYIAREGADLVLMIAGGRS